MDYFNAGLSGLCLAAQSAMHMIFAGRLTGKQPKLRQFAAYFFLLCTVQSIALGCHLADAFAVGAQMLILYGMNRFALNNQRSVSCVAATIAIYISQLSFGIVNAIEAVIFPSLLGRPLLYVLLFFATAVAFLLCACCYAAVWHCLSLSEGEPMPYVGLLLLPGGFFFAAELYILQTAYSDVSVVLSPRESAAHAALLLLQVLGLAALLCTLYVWRHVVCGFLAQAELNSLRQAVRAQKTYVCEAQMRCEQSRAFRHDIKNHLSVLNGLLNNARIEEAREYLQTLSAVSDSLSVFCQTGNPVVDILLSEKLRIAEAAGIAVQASVILPNPCGVDEFDLCVIFANALDNAISACQEARRLAKKTEEAASIGIFGERQGDFYRLVFENTCPLGPLPPAGIGLSNIKAAAERYGGSMLAEKTGQRFFLHILLNISFPSSDRSVQMP